MPSHVVTFDHYGVYTRTDGCIVQKNEWVYTRTDGDGHRCPLGVCGEQVGFYSFVMVVGLCFLMLR
jgi:hypothetical protein